jgi:DNA-binding response OmpR family regulator
MAHNGKDGLELLKLYSYDMILLDWGLPDLTGLDVLKSFRADGGKTPVIFLTGRSETKDKETGLDSGADDYLTKPFDVKELAARIRAVLRRPQHHVDPLLTIGDITIDRSRHKVTKAGSEVKLYRREFALLDFLMCNSDCVFTAEELLDRVWSSEAGVSAETVRTAAARLRKQLDSPSEPSIIENIRGFGYKVRGS